MEKKSMTKNDFLEEWIKNVKASVWKNEIIRDYQEEVKNETEVTKAEEVIASDKKFLKFLVKKLDK